MCLSIPAKIISIESEKAKANIGGSIVEINLQLVDDVTIGDYVLVHTGFALEKINEAEALNTLQLINELRIDSNAE
jgi:hydrogenase expression/formation protein HypC